MGSQRPYSLPIGVEAMAKVFRNKEVLLAAAKELGVQEWVNGSNPRVEKYLDHGASAGNKDSGLSDDVPWCAGFVAFCMESVGMTSTNSLMARSYERWGKSTLDDPQPGDVVTFYRGNKSDGLGHVAILVKKSGSYLWCLGGNQKDEVNLTRYTTKMRTDIRRSTKQYFLSADDKRILAEIAADILEGNEVAEPGKVT
jgi:uncharacterized protein (TIGR02594 family)